MAEPKSTYVRRPFPQTNAFRPFVIDELRRRATSYPNPINAPFVKLTSCKYDPDNNYAFFTLGLHGYGASDINIFDVTYGGGKDIVGYASDLNSQNLSHANKRLIFSDEVSPMDISSNVQDKLRQMDEDAITHVQEDIARQVGNQRIVYAGGAHPIPGITGITVKRDNIGMPLYAQIRWSCYNRSQLEFLRNHFMTAGGHCVIEFGQNFHNKQISKVLDFQNIDQARSELVDAITNGRKYIIDNYVKPNEGNYDFMPGTIGNYTVELDGATGIYQCTTTLVGVGEEAWGLSNHMTMIRKNPSTDSNDIYKPSTFHDYFRYGGMFDQQIESELAAGHFDMVSNYHSTAKNFKGDAFDGYSNNPQDYRFVSWDFVCNRMIPRMMELISDVGIKDDVGEFIKFFTSQQDEVGVDPDNQVWVGDNKDLRSVDPDTMLLIKSNMKDIPTELTTCGYFDQFEGAEGFRGKLRQGVWLTSGVLRQCFLGTTTFQTAIISILDRMSSASGGYWRLQLFFDSDAARYKIIDNKYCDGRDKTLMPFYKFNTSGKGELLEVHLDSQFPPELVTQVMMYANFKSQPQERQNELLEKWPAIGTTSMFAIALNWTSLRDITEADMAKRNDHKDLLPLQRVNLMVPAKGMTNTQTVNIRTANRVAGADAVNIGAPAVSSKDNPLTGVRQSTTQPAILPINQPRLYQPVKAMPPATRNSAKPDPSRPAVVVRADQYKSLIEQTAQEEGVDADLIRAVIAQESGFNSSASRTELLLGDASQGLMQITLKTAKGMGFAGTSAELATPENSVKYGAKFLAECVRSRKGNMEDAISMYNGGYRPKLGFGTLATAPVKVCLQWSQKEKGVCEIHRNVPVGSYGNQPHVNKVMGYYNQFRVDSAKAPVTGTTTNASGAPMATPTAVDDALYATPNPFKGITNPKNTVATNTSASDQTKAALNEEALAKKDNINARFGSGVSNAIAPSEAAMINLITRDGYANHPQPNSFAAPFATTTAVEVTILGLSGISISDAFIVDRLPFIFEQYGVFQVTALTDTVSGKGWITKIRGYFKMLWLNGDGHTKKVEK